LKSFSRFQIFTLSHLKQIFFLTAFLSFFGNIRTSAQVDTIYQGDKKIPFYKKEIVDTTEISDSALVNIKKPAHAAFYSMILPGLGQAYNGNYWKIPIIYTAISVSIFWADFNNKYYHRYKTAYILNTDGNPATVDEFNGKVSAADLLYYTKQKRRNRDLSIIVAGVFYLLNIVDATVDSNMADYDIGDDISMKVQPAVIPMINEKNSIGLSLSFRFK
jgi:hypothetical protein